MKSHGATLIGGSFWTPKITSIGSAIKSFDQIMKRLFANGEQGAYFDPNDLSTMFQDAAGTIPVTGVGQPVGLILDKSKGLVLGSELVTNGDFSSGFSGWSNANNYWQIVDGKAYHALGSVLNTLQRTITLTNHAWLEFDYEVIQGTAQLQYFGGPVNITVELQGKGRHRAFIPKGTSLFLFKRKDNVEIYIDNVSLKEITGNHAYQNVSASRPLLQRNATTGAYYLSFDGIDDFLVTNNIDFTATDKLSLFAGVRKLSDAVTASLIKLGADLSVGRFEILMPPSAGSVQYELSTDSSWVKFNAGTSPITQVLTAQFDRAETTTTNEVKSRLDGIAVNGVSNSGITTIGNFSNLPLFIGRRNGTTLPFNGHIYGLIILGRLATDTETKAIEAEFAKRMGVTLSV